MDYNSGVNVQDGYSEPVMTEERKKYLLEKEKKIKKRNQIKKIIRFSLIFIILLVIISYLYKNYFRPVKIDSRIDKNSIHYVTDLYYSDGRYYNEYLDVKERKLYVEILNDLKDIKNETIIDCRNFGYTDKHSCSRAIFTIIDIILMEHPDLFWYRTSSYSYGIDIGVVVKHHYVSKNKLRLYFVEKRMLRKIDELASRLEKMSQEEQVKSVYTWLGETTSYSTIITRKSGTAWSALLNDDSVCAGFAAASQLLFQRLGIESILVTGNHNGGGHAWNFVKLDDKYYWYDSTVAGSFDRDSDYFYDGLLFYNTGEYAVDVLDLNKYNFAS